MERGKALVPGMQQGALERFPRSGGALTVAENRNLMVLYYFNGWYEQAARKSAHILKANPTDLFALWYNGLARMAQKQYPDAVSSLKKLSQLDPKLVAAHMELGQAYALINDRQCAALAFKKAAGDFSVPCPRLIALWAIYIIKAARRLRRSIVSKSDRNQPASRCKVTVACAPLGGKTGK